MIRALRAYAATLLGDYFDIRGQQTTLAGPVKSRDA
jgi:hypothetical protein